ncbi:hypothetical protein [Flavobacterium branchiophilum]|uniref:Uncharacterized protein n=1 Tax=Flavobacterium branchiophilum TaxID=55197 RepID=A0A2H3KSL8_9FLAO|nr:hypothetical protein [Flavobacterium branchiophilum]PDS22544.1 hypothetical protein B0A77_13360 [Flavobacterium branchiophilum]
MTIPHIWYQKSQWIIRLTAVFWLIAKIGTFKLWTADRLLPLVPPFAFLENIPNSVHLFLYIVVLCHLFFTLINTNCRWIYFSTIFFEILSCALDQNRWQPYIYQYILIFLFAGIFFKKNIKFINLLQFLLIVIYFNSGLHKLNSGFLYNVWQNMILHRFIGLDYTTIQSPWLYQSGYILGLIETFAGIALCFTRFQNRAAWIMIGMHVFILVLITPIGLNYNVIVWPWNVLMIGLLYLIFVKKEQTETLNWIKLFSGKNMILFVLLGIMPLTNFFGIWDHFLSFNLYSGSSMKMEICIENPQETKQFEPYYSSKKTFCKTQSVIQSDDWALKELHIVVYPEKRVYEKIIQKWKLSNPNAKAVFHIYKYPYRKNDIFTYQ